MPSGDELRRILKRIDGRGYKAYGEIRGQFELSGCCCFVDHVQGDPFAAPSKLRLRVALLDTALSSDLFENPVRGFALEDWLARRLRASIGNHTEESRRSDERPTISVDAGGQEVLQRTAVVVTADWVEARLEVNLPANGRRILGRRAEALLCDALPRLASDALCQLPPDDARRFVDAVENQEDLRSRLASLGLIAFVGDGALLPRESGASDRPLPADAAVPFVAPESLRVEVDVLHPYEVNGEVRRSVTGLGIRRGVTLIVGGGYHGKSTLLRAIERGIYPHIPGDGREWVISDGQLVKIRAEDGRRVEQVDIDSFIHDLPRGRSTGAFDSDDASGSTSQAANIVEALEVGATGLLLDEDTSATNFMVRDARMQELIQKRHEPITPFVERVRELWETFSISTVLVMGGCGDYFEAADVVIAMREFQPIDVTAEAKQIAAGTAAPRRNEAGSPIGPLSARIPIAQSFDPSRGRREVSIKTRGRERIEFGRTDIDLRAVEQLVDASQTRAIASAIHLAATRFMDGSRTLAEALDEIDALFDSRGLDELDPRHRPERHPGNYARPRRFEIAAAINRLRTVRMKQRR